MKGLTEGRRKRERKQPRREGKREERSFLINKRKNKNGRHLEREEAPANSIESGEDPFFQGEKEQRGLASIRLIPLRT